MHKFIKERDPNNKFDKTRVEIEVDTDYLPDLVEAFEEYLRACGFHFKGSLDFIEEEDADVQPL